MKNKGFTMVELLATITILGIIMLIAVPNVISIIDKNKKRTYIEDAKKLQIQAEYQLRKNTTMEKPATGKSIVITLQNLDLTELADGPEGGTYSGTQSFVLISNEGGTYKYYVALRENYGSNKKAGINLTDIALLNGENAINQVVKDSEMVDYTLQIGRTLPKGGTIQDVY